MTKINLLAVRLLELTRQLQSMISDGALDQIDVLQQERARIIAELDLSINDKVPVSDLDDCRMILNEVSSIEAIIVEKLQKSRSQILKSVQEIKSNKIALDSYDQFR